MGFPAFIASAFPHIARLFAGNAARAAATQAPRLGLGGIIKSAYGNGGMGLMNLGMDVIPLAMDIANNDVGLKSFSSFGGTLLGTKFGGRELNRAGEDLLKRKERLATAEYTARAMNNNRTHQQLGLPSARSPVNARKTQYGETGTFLERNPNANKFVDDRVSKLRGEYLNDPQYSRQGYNMPIGFAADALLYSGTAGMNKPKPTDFETQMLQGQSVSPVTRYMQMTGEL